MAWHGAEMSGTHGPYASAAEERKTCHPSASHWTEHGGGSWVKGPSVTEVVHQHYLAISSGVTVQHAVDGAQEPDQPSLWKGMMMLVLGERLQVAFAFAAPRGRHRRWRGQVQLSRCPRRTQAYGSANCNSTSSPAPRDWWKLGAYHRLLQNCLLHGLPAYTHTHVHSHRYIHTRDPPSSVHKQLQNNSQWWRSTGV